MDTNRENKGDKSVGSENKCKLVRGVLYPPFLVAAFLLGFIVHVNMFD